MTTRATSLAVAVFLVGLSGAAQTSQEPQKAVGIRITRGKKPEPFVS